MLRAPPPVCKTATGLAELPGQGQKISPRLWNNHDYELYSVICTLSYGAGQFRRLLGERINDDFKEGLVLTEILGTKAEIQLTWRCKPELRIRMVRFMMENCGHAGVKALASVIKLTHREIYEIGGIEGWLGKLKCQRRQRRKRQKKKLSEYTVEITYEKEPVAKGGGKRGKGGGIQDAGKRAIMQSIYG